MTKKRKWLFFSISLFCILFAGTLKFLQQKWNMTFFLLQMTSTGWISVSLILCAFCLSILLFSLFSKPRKNPKLHTFLFPIFIILSIVMLIIFTFICLFYGFIRDSKYYTFHSPLNDHTIIVEEQSFLLAGYGNFYVKENALFMKYVDYYTTDDGYRPFKFNDYHVKWEKDRATIFYGFGSGDVQKETVIQLK